MKPLVAIVADIREFDLYEWHVTPSQYVDAACDIAGVTPLLVPAMGERLDIDTVLQAVDGVMLSGSKTNVHPSLFGEQADPKFEPYDEARDATSLPLIRRAVELGVPLFAICRGIQELNVALGGQLQTEIQEREGVMDHRVRESDDNDVRFATVHDVAPDAQGCLASILGDKPVRVNSLHRQAISALAPRLRVEAIAPDGTIEAVSVIDAKAFAIGVQWHPEYWASSDGPSKALFEAFGDAVRAHANERAG